MAIDELVLSKLVNNDSKCDTHSRNTRETFGLKQQRKEEKISVNTVKNFSFVHNNSNQKIAKMKKEQNNTFARVWQWQ